MDPKADQNRIAIIDLLRSISILLVMGGHFQAISAQFHPAVGWQALPDNFLWQHLRNGALGVSIFFLVSGFVITRSTLLRENDPASVNIKAFYQRRAARILPLFIVVVAVSAIISWGARTSWPAYYDCFGKPDKDPLFWIALCSFWLNWLIVIRQVHFGLQWDINWSLSIEEQFYAAFPLCLRYLRTRSRLVILASLLVLAGPLVRSYLRIANPQSTLPAMHNSFSGFEPIALGVILYLSVEKTGAFFRRRKTLSSIICAAGAAIMGFAFYRVPYPMVYAPTLIAAGTFLFVLGGIHLSIFDKLPRFLTVPGKLSYGCYLIHSLMLFCLFPLLDRLPLAWALICYFATTLFMAALSYDYFEEPVNKLIRNKLKSKKNRKASLTPPTVF